MDFIALIISITGLIGVVAAPIATIIVAKINAGVKTKKIEPPPKVNQGKQVAQDQLLTMLEWSIQEIKELKKLETENKELRDLLIKELDKENDGSSA